jgi:hypothetical protein
VIVGHLQTYLKAGRIATKEDFKHLARKLTHLVLEKEKKFSDQKLLSDEIKRKIIKFVDTFFSRLNKPYKAAHKD